MGLFRFGLIMIKVEILRNLLLRYGGKIGLKPQEILLAWHMLDHDFDGVGYSYPGEARLAERMGFVARPGSVHGQASCRREVSKWIKRLEAKHLIHVTRRLGVGNRYRFYGLIKKLLPFYDEELGRTKKKVLKVDVRQVDLPLGGGANAPHPRGKRPSHRGANAPLNSSSNSSINSLTNDNGDDSKSDHTKDELNLDDQKFETAKEVVDFLRQLVENPSPVVSSAADAALRLLEELWKLNQPSEVVKSWRWFFYSAKTRPQAFDRAASIMRQRVAQVGQGVLRNPGAYFTRVYKSL